MKDNATRLEIERRILGKSEEIPVTATNWWTSNQLEEFLEAWDDLSDYFEQGTDYEISVELFADYASLMRAMIRALIDRLSEDDRRNMTRLEERISDLQVIVGNLKRYAISNRQDSEGAS